MSAVVHELVSADTAVAAQPHCMYSVLIQLSRCTAKLEWESRGVVRDERSEIRRNADENKSGCELLSTCSVFIDFHWQLKSYCLIHQCYSVSHYVLC